MSPGDPVLVKSPPSSPPFPRTNAGPHLTTPSSGKVAGGLLDTQHRLKPWEPETDAKRKQASKYPCEATGQLQLFFKKKNLRQIV